METRTSARPIFLFLTDTTQPFSLLSFVGIDKHRRGTDVRYIVFLTSNEKISDILWKN